jgi:anti-sigma factor (TIGR02949 family)
MGEGVDAMTRMSCDEAIRQFFAYLDRALSGEPLEALEAHLQDCLDCCERLQFSRRLDSALKARLAAGSVPEGVEDRVRERLAKLRVDAAKS